MAASIALALLGATISCSRAREVALDATYELNPFASTEVTVQTVSVLGPYLLFEVRGRRERIRLLAPKSPTCGRVLQPELRVRYQRSGVFGRLLRDDEACDAAGVASLEGWRSRQPRARPGAQVVPRATARFSLLVEEERYLLVRGRFPLASRVQIPSGFDLVAMLPANAACREAVSRGEASMEFRPAGRQPFRLIVSGEFCEIEGFALPVEPSREAPASTRGSVRVARHLRGAG